MSYAVAPRITRVEASEPHKLLVGFSDGSEQNVDVEPLFGNTWFAMLRDPAMFRSVTIDPNKGLVWPNGPAMDAWTLHDWQTAGPPFVATVQKQARGARRLRTFQRGLLVALVLFLVIQWRGWFGLGPASPSDVRTSVGLIVLVSAQLIQERSIAWSLALTLVAIALVVANVALR